MFGILRDIPLLACVLALWFAAIGEGAGATITVVNLSDSGAGSLRQQIAAASAGDTIVFANGLAGTITLATGELAVNKNLTILGPGAKILTINGNHSSRVLNLSSGILNLSDLTLSNGISASPSYRGGNVLITSPGVLNLRNCRVTAGQSAQEGGGIDNYGGLSLSACMLDNNYCTNSSGGGINSIGTLAMTNCTFAFNGAGYGGGVYNGGTAAIRNCTIVSNHGGGAAGGLFADGAVSVWSSIIAGNTSPIGPDVNNTALSGGYNLIGSTNGSGGFALTGSHDQVGSTASPLNALLGPLQDNGGSTLTMSPLPGSPSIDQGNSSGLPTDQRGRPRPSDDSAVVNAGGGDGSDIGAVELSPLTLIVANTNDNGAGSLRQAIASASLVDNDLITFATDVVGNIGLTTGELVLGKPLRIQGSPTAPIAINGNNTNRIFRTTANSSVTISSLTLTNARTAADGGAMLNDFGCTLSLSNCAVTANTSGGNGGGLANNGNFVAYNCTFSGNQAAFNAGAIYTYAGPVTLRNCTIVSNTAVSASGTGGGILNYSLVAGTSNNLGSTIVAGNSAASHPDVIGVFTSSGYNLIGKIDYSTAVGGGANNVPTGGLTNNISHDQVGSIGTPINPLLGPLQANGGSTVMLAPLPGSPAIDQGNSTGLPTDQRGRPRPIDNPAVVNAGGGDGSDIGAVEISPLTLIVANTNDVGIGSLRQTVLDAAAGDTISFAMNVTGAITFSNSAVLVSQDVMIRGPGARALAINGSTNNHIFTVSTGVVLIADLTLSNGRSVSGGGIQLGGGALTLSNCVVSGNSANTNSGSGGGINASGGSLVVLNSTFSGNEARFGGGIWNCCAQVSITNTTFTGNQAIGGNGSDGGALHNSGTLTLQSCTISSNTAGGAINGSGGGGIRNFSVAHIGNSIIARNSSPGGELDAGGVFISDGYNIIGARTGSNGGGFTNGISQDQVGTTNAPIDPLLGPLQDNGGPTPTMSPLAGSPALDQGNRFGLTSDQRSAPRPFDFVSRDNAASGDGSDIGAFELGSPALNIQAFTTDVVLSWPSYYGDFSLQALTNIIASNSWANVAGTPVVVANQFVLTNGPISGNKFYRLKGN